MHIGPTRLTSLIRALVTLSIVCVGVATVASPVPPEAMASSKRAEKPAKNTRQRLTKGNTTFALKIFHEVTRGTTHNVMVSPISLTVSLGMTYAGARGETASQMAGALSFLLPQSQLHPALGWLSHSLLSRGDKKNGSSDSDLTFNMTNALWAEQSQSYEADFLNTLSRNYEAGLQKQNFIGDSSGARVAINDWVAEQTQDRIKDLLPPDVINPQTRLVLTNAVYFVAPWATPFSTHATRFDFFTLLSGKKRTSPLMHKTAKYKHMAGDAFEAVELDYQGKKMSMLAIVPDHGRYEEVAGRLDSTLLSTIKKKLKKKKLRLYIPRFTFESELKLDGPMKNLGMKKAFDLTNANFSGMTGRPDLSIAAILQKTFVKVDERGTEAAAASLVAVRSRSMRPPDPELKINRPFIFIVQDKPTGTVLFIGRMAEPTE